jgi:hypothetical protein
MAKQIWNLLYDAKVKTTKKIVVDGDGGPRVVIPKGTRGKITNMSSGRNNYVNVFFGPKYGAVHCFTEEIKLA